MDPASDTSGESFVNIPGEPSLAKTTGIPPVRLPLPLVSQIRSGFLVFLCVLVIGIFGLLLISTAVLILSEPPSSAPSFMTMVAGVLALPTGILVAGAAFIYTADVANSATIRVDENGFWDSRFSTQMIPWQEVAKAAAVPGQIATYDAVRRRLRSPVIVARNGFRFGGWRYLFWRRPDELFIPMIEFPRKREIVLAILELVRRHGGEVTEKYYSRSW